MLVAEVVARSQAHEGVQEGPVHDVQWAPQGGSFCIIAGYMPAQVHTPETTGVL